MHSPLTHPALMDCRRLFLRDYEVRINIGVHAFEKTAEQRVVMNVDLYIPLAVSTPRADALDEVVGGGAQPGVGLEALDDPTRLAPQHPAGELAQPVGARVGARPGRGEDEQRAADGALAGGLPVDGAEDGGQQGADRERHRQREPDGPRRAPGAPR